MFTVLFLSFLFFNVCVCYLWASAWNKRLMMMMMMMKTRTKLVLNVNGFVTFSKSWGYVVVGLNSQCVSKCSEKASNHTIKITRFSSILLYITAVAWICRKIRGSGSVRSSHQTKFKATRKISFTFYFWHKSYILHDVKLAELPTTVLNERMWHFRVVKTYSYPSYLFSGGVRIPTPWSTPLSHS